MLFVASTRICLQCNLKKGCFHRDIPDLLAERQLVDSKIGRSEFVKIDLTNNKMEASFCDEAAGECVRAITYIVLAKRMAGKTTFTLVLQSASLGEKRLEIKVNELQ